MEKLLPFYLVAFIGYLAARGLKIRIEDLAKLYFYVFLPPIVFYGVYTVPFFSGVMFLPLIYFAAATILALIFLLIGKKIFKDATAYLLSLTVGMGNVGNLGVPLSIALFGKLAAGPAALTVVGFLLYANTVGFFIASKGHYTTKDALVKIAKLPSLYAFVLAVILQLSHVDISKLFFYATLDNFISAYNVLGLLLVGVGIAGISHESLDKAYLVLSMIAKFVIWPLFALFIIVVDRHMTHLLTPFSSNIFLLQATAPIALNVISVSSILKLYPEKVSLAVAVSTLFAIVYIPIFLAFFLK